LIEMATTTKPSSAASAASWAVKNAAQSGVSGTGETPRERDARF
jgi:hypothetical protein